MTTLNVAFQGERGAFSETAAKRLLGGDIDALPCDTFEDMFGSVADGRADCCVAPIENSLAGSIHRNYDLLLESDLHIVGETNLRIVHNLIAPAGVELADVKHVYSHPVALAQCTRFLKEHPAMKSSPLHDTAGSVRIVMEQNAPDAAAIASADAADIHGGTILARGIEDNQQNYTRFLLLRKGSEPLPVLEPARRWKTSLIFWVANKPAALFRALGAFAILEIDLAKIESRPIEGRPWEYAFYLDLIGKADDPNVRRALDNLGQIAEDVRVLGSYGTRW